MVSLCEQVRNRLLRFALEIRRELAEVDDKPEEVPGEKVEAAIINYIYGGTNVIAGTAANFTQANISARDFDGLSKALKAVNITKEEIDDLKEAIEHDHMGFGARTREWVMKAATSVARTGVQAGAAAGQEVLKELLFQYFGLK